jgi:hypothetical protein
VLRCMSLFLAHFAPFNIGGRRVRLWRVQENNDRRLIAHRTWTEVDPNRSRAVQTCCDAISVAGIPKVAGAEEVIKLDVIWRLRYESATSCAGSRPATCNAPRCCRTHVRACNRPTSRSFSVQHRFRRQPWCKLPADRSCAGPSRGPCARSSPPGCDFAQRRGRSHVGRSEGTPRSSHGLVRLAIPPFRDRALNLTARCSSAWHWRGPAATTAML